MTKNIFIILILISSIDVSASEYGNVVLILSKSPISFKDRIVAAKFIEKECKVILSNVPELSPLQLKWLEDTTRIRKNIHLTPEFNRRVLFLKYSRCVKGAKMAQSMNSNKPKHTLGWAIVASSLFDPDTKIYIERARYNILSKYALRAEALYLFSKNILDNIVIQDLDETVELNKVISNRLHPPLKLHPQ